MGDFIPFRVDHSSDGKQNSYDVVALQEKVSIPLNYRGENSC